MINKAQKYNPKYKQVPLFDFKEELRLVQCVKEDSEFAYFYTTHYPSSKGIIGRQLNYKIYYGNEFIGIIGANSPPGNQYGYKKFNEYFNITIKEYNTFLNNNVYRITSSKKNRGTKVLKLFRVTEGLLRQSSTCPWMSRVKWPAAAEAAAGNATIAVTWDRLTAAGLIATLALSPRSNAGV